MSDEVDELESLDPADERGKQKAIVDKWRKLLDAEDKAHKEFRDEAEKAYEQYMAEEDGQNYYNILWSNVQIQLGALFSGQPKAEVRRRNKDVMGPQKDAALVIERALDFMVDSTDFTGIFSRSVQDFLASGLGVPKLVYDAEMGSQPQVLPNGEPVLNDEGEPVMVEYIKNQSVTIDYFPYANFRWQPAKSWEKVDWVAFEVTKSRTDVIDEYNVKADEDEDVEGGHKEVKLTEIWHKPSRTIIVICDQFDTPLEVREDVLGLQGFYPVPKPLMTNVADRLTPKPDYAYYEKQCKELNKLVKRVGSLINSVKDVGFYDSALEEMNTLENKPDGSLVPVDGVMTLLGERPDLNSVIAKLPIEHTMGVVASLRGEIESVKQQIYEIVGLSDIMRGASDAQETAQAQGIKAQFGSIRMRSKQVDVSGCVRELFRMMAEIIGEHFEVSVLSQMTGVEVNQDVEQILRNDVMRNFSIDVETDSTIAKDEAEELEKRMTALQSISGYITSLLPAMAQGQVPDDIGREMLLMAIRGFKYSGDLEDMISQMPPANMVPQLQQQVQEMGMQIQQLQAQLQQFGELERAEKVADIRETNAKAANYEAQAGEAAADTQTKKIENAINMQRGLVGAQPVALG